MEANGEVERAVKNIKNPLKTAQDSFKALLNNRNTLLDGISPVSYTHLTLPTKRIV